MKLCKDCKHCINISDGEENAKCIRGYLSPVTGEYTEDHCHYSRSGIKACNCGFDARFWEPKE